MSVITFVNNLDETTGKSLSIAAIATSMAINYNNRILVLSTTKRHDKILSCFFEEDRTKKMRMSLFGMNKNGLETETGIQGLAKISRSNKIEPNIITNYTKVIFKDRLELLPGRRSVDGDIDSEYIDLIIAAKSFYDYVMVDLDNDISDETRKKITELSDLIVVVSSQNYLSLKNIKEEKKSNELLQLPKTLILIGRFDRYSKYNIKNITRFLGEKNKILTVPYNTLFMESSNEGTVPDLFLRFRNISDTEDNNAIFIEEVKRASENIIYRLQELQARMQ